MINLQKMRCLSLHLFRWIPSLFVIITLFVSLLPISLTYKSLRAQNDIPQSNTPRNRAALINIATVERIRNRGNMLIVGVLHDYPPFSFFDGNGNATGFEPDLVRAMAELWDLEVTFVPITPSTRLQHLLAGQIDLVAAALPHTVANDLVADFSTNYFDDTTALLLPAESQIINFQALAGKTIASVQGSEAATQLTAYLANLDVTVSLLPFQEAAPALLALKAGQADALLGDQAYLSLVARQQLERSVILPLASDNHFGFGIAPGDSFFRNLVNFTLQELYTTGVYAEIYAKWFPAEFFGDTPTATLPTIAMLPGQWPYRFDTLPVLVSEQPISQLTTMRERGILLAGVSYDVAPFGFLNQAGVVEGFEIDLVREFARRWLGNADAIEFVRVTPDTAIPLLNAGQVDLLATTLPHSWPRAAEVDFSTTYYHDTLGALVRVDSNVQSIADLARRTIATVAGIKGWNETAQLLDRAFSTQPVIVPFQEYRTAEQALRGGQIDAVIGSTTVLFQVADSDPNLQLLPEPLSSQPYGMGLPQFDTELRNLVDFTLQAMKIDGSYDQIYSQWFPGEPYAVALWLDAESQQQFGAVSVSPNSLPIPLSEAVTSPEKGPILPLITPTTLVVDTLITDTMAIDTPVTSITEIEFFATATPELATIEIVASIGITVAPVAELFPTTVTVLDDVNINAHSRPAANAPVLMAIASGTSWQVVTLSNDGEWVQIGLPSGLQGWVARKLLVTPVTFALSAATPVVAATPTLSPPTATPVPLLPVETPTLLPPAATPTYITRITHQTRSTDTLADIAQEYYGDQTLWRPIYDANREIIGDNPNVIPVGVVLDIPLLP